MKATAFGVGLGANGQSRLNVTTNGGNATVQLSGTGTAPPPPIVSLSTNVLVFPNTTINANSLPAPVTITNIGGTNLILGAANLAGANPGDFVIAGNSCSGATLPPAPAPSSSCTLSVSFGPTLQGTRSASLTIPSNAAGSPSSVSLSGTGLAAPAPAATLSTSSLTFASQTVGANGLPQSVTLTNTGNANLLLGTLSVSGTNPGDYLVVTNTCNNATLIPSATCAFSVSFQPTATGTRIASVAISSNAAGSPHSVSLSGTGAAPTAPAATLSTSSLTFGSLTVGLTSTPQTVVLTNSGTANLVLGVLTLSGANPADYSVATNTCNSATLAPNANCAFSVRFTPTVTGTRTASVTITSNAAGNPHSVSLSGTGVAPTAPAATLSTSSLTFGSLMVGSTSASQSVVLTNSGTANLVLGALTLSGTNSGDYLVATNTCSNATLSPNGNCSISVSFKPTATGTRTASITISSNAVGSPHSVGLSGSGVTQPPSPPTACVLAATPPSLPASGGNVALTVTCSGGGLPSAYMWTGGFANGLSTVVNSVSGAVTQTTTFSVVARNLSGSSDPASVTVIVTALPTTRTLSIISVIPKSGAVGTVVTIGGFAFGASQGSSTVRFGNVVVQPADILRWGNNHIRVHAPSPDIAGTRPIVVTVNGQSSANNCALTDPSNPDCSFTYPPTVSLSQIDLPPAAGAPQTVRWNNRARVQLQLALVQVASDQAPVNNSSQDACYIGAMDAIRLKQTDQIVGTAINQLAAGIVGAAIGNISTGSVLGDLFLHVSADLLTAAAGQEPLPQAALLSVTGWTAGYIVGNLASDFLADPTSSATDFTIRAVSQLLQDEQLIAWSLSGDNSADRNRDSLGVPLTAVSLKAIHSLKTHYTTLGIRASCALPTGTVEKLYVVTYRAEQGVLGSFNPDTNSLLYHVVPTP